MTRASAALLAMLPAALLAQAAPGAPPPRPLEEKTIYVPYDKLAEVFEKEGRGIFLPYREFLELWQRAQPKPPPPPVDEPPAEAVISGGLYTGEVRDGLARFEVEYTIVALKRAGWSKIALALADAAIEEATIEEIERQAEVAAVAPSAAVDPVEPSPPLIAHRGDHYEVFLPRPGSYRVRLRLGVRVDSKPGRRSFAFGIPPAAISRLDLNIPEPNAQLEVQPMMAATRVEEKDGATRVLAFLGSADRVSVSWSPPAGALDKEAALLLANQALRGYIGERVLRISTDIDLQILRQEVDRIRVQMPQDMEVLSVNGENIREWTVDRQAQPPVLELRLHSGVQSAYRFNLAFERILRETPTSLSVPLPRVEGVLRESGFLALSNDDGLNVRVAAAEGLSQQDLSELPESLRANAFVGFRYLAQPVSLTVEIEKILPVIHSESTSVVIFGVEEDSWIGWVDYRITRSGVFALTLELPARWRVQSVGDETTVEDFQSAPRENDATTQVLTVNLRNRASGNFRLPFQLTAPGSASAGEKTLAALRPQGVEGDRGTLGVGGPRAFRIATGERANMIPVDAQELFRSGIQGRIPQDAVADLAFSFYEHPASVKVTLEERRTEIKVSSRILVNVLNNAVQVQQDLEYLIQFAAVDAISFSAPTTYDDRIRYEVAGSRDLRKTPLGDGRTRWDISLQSRFLGVKTIKVAYDESLDDLTTGEPKSIVLPLIRAEGAELRGEDGAVAIRKEGNLEVGETVQGLEPIDPRELPPELAQGRIFRAFRFAQPSYRLELRLIRNEYIALADAIVELILTRGLLTRERVLDADTLVVVENSGRQYLDLGFPGGYRNVRFFVNAQEVTPQRIPGRPEEELRVPLRGAQGTTLVRARYQVGLGDDMGAAGSFQVRAPRVLTTAEGGDVARVPVRKVELELRVPPEYVYFLGAGTLRDTARAVAAPWSWALWSLFSNYGVVRVEGNAARVYGQVTLPDVPTEFAREETRFYRLETSSPEGDIAITYLGRRWFTVVNLAVFAAAIAAALWAAKKWRAERWWILSGAAAVLLLIGWLSDPGKAVLALSALRGAALATALIVVRSCVPRVRQAIDGWRAERVALAPDPFLEDAPRSKPATPPSAPAPLPAPLSAPAPDRDADPDPDPDADADADPDAGTDPDQSKRRRKRKKGDES